MLCQQTCHQSHGVRVANKVLRYQKDGVRVYKRHFVAWGYHDKYIFPTGHCKAITPKSNVNFITKQNISIK